MYIAPGTMTMMIYHHRGGRTATLIMSKVVMSFSLIFYDEMRWSTDISVYFHHGKYFIIVHYTSIFFFLDARLLFSMINNYVRQQVGCERGLLNREVFDFFFAIQMTSGLISWGYMGSNEHIVYFTFNWKRAKWKHFGWTTRHGGLLNYYRPSNSLRPFQ